jgi:hypothetical protein
MGQLGPPPSRVRNPVREPELSGHGECLPHAHHQPRRASLATVDWARTDPVAPAADAPAPAQADAAGPSAPQHRRRSGQRSRQARTERRRAARVASQRDAIADETATAPTGGRGCGFRAAVSGLRFPLGLRGTAMAHTSSASVDVAVREGRPGRHAPAARNLTATTNDESYHGSTSELPPATSHGYTEWDFSGVRTR